MQIIENFSNEHNDFFTLIDNSKQEYEWHKRKGSKMSAEAILLLIRKREYPETRKNIDYIIDENQSELQALEEWIKDGCMLSAITRDDPVYEDFPVYGEVPVLDEEGMRTFEEIEGEQVLITETEQTGIESKQTGTTIVEITPERVAEKVEWKGTHPKPSRIIDGEKLSEETLKEFDLAKTLEEFKVVFKKMMKGSK